jgi:uncharacterized peroxidase-related enzyme
MTNRPHMIDPLPDELSPLFTMVEAAMGFVPNSLKIMARRPSLLQSAVGLFAYMNHPDCGIEPGLVQMIGYMSSYGAGCRYCQAHTAHGAGHSGVAAEKIEQLWRFQDSELFDDRERAALAYALAAGQTPNAVDDSHFAALSGYFSAEEIIDITAIIAIFGFLNRWNDTLGTALESAPIAHAESHLGASGWTIGKHGG